MMNALRKSINTALDILEDFNSPDNINSKSWGFLHGTSVKLIRAALKSVNEIPIELAQILTTSCKFFGWPGLKIERTTIPGKFREQSYQFLKKYFEDKYGNYPLPIEYHWNSSIPLNIQWITPTNRTMSSKPPTLYHIHGGAWALLHSCAYNHIFRDLTEPSSSQVMSIEYRLIPQVPLLSQLEDVLAGYFYLSAPASQGGAGNKTSQIVVGGESAGAHLCSMLLHILRNTNTPNFAGSYLISPAVDLTFSQPSFFENSNRDYLWQEEAPVRVDSGGMHIYSNLSSLIYNNSPKYASDRMKKDGSVFGPKELLIWPEISPLLDSNMNGLPPAIIIVGDRDSLRDTGILYGKLRAEAEIKSKNKTTIIPNVQTYNFDEGVHAFPSLPPNKYTRKAVKTMGEFIYQALNANDIKALDSKKYGYLPDYKKSYMSSTYNMYWNNLENQYSSWNSTYAINPLTTATNLTQPIQLLPPISQ
jgi:acetyl esterase/lipase